MVHICDSCSPGEASQCLKIWNNSEFAFVIALDSTLLFGFLNHFYLLSGNMQKHTVFSFFLVCKLPLNRTWHTSMFPAVQRYSETTPRQDFYPLCSSNSRFFHVSSHSTVSWAQLNRWRQVSDKTDSGQSENKVFLHGSSFRSAACQHLWFPIKTTNQLKTWRQLTSCCFFCLFFIIEAILEITLFFVFRHLNGFEK